MTKSINAALLGFTFFLVAYCLCFWFGIMPKFYPMLGEIHIIPPAGSPIAVKFVGSAIVGGVAGFGGFLFGKRLPETWCLGLHVMGWVTMMIACCYLVGREMMEYIFK